MSSKRIESIDVFRGLSVALMILVEYMACSSFAPEILRHGFGGIGLHLQI